MPATPTPARSPWMAQARALMDAGQPFCLCRFPQKSGDEGVRLFVETDAEPGGSFVVQSWKGEVTAAFGPAESGHGLSAKKVRKGLLYRSLPAHTSFEAYRAGFDLLKEAFARGEAQKAVLSRVKRMAKPVDFDPFTFFDKLETAYPNALVYLTAHPVLGTWMGATPEVLLDGEGSSWRTHSLAGTMAAHGEGPYPWTAKEREEQELVSVHVREVLRASGISHWEERGPDTALAGSVAHLRTVFEFAQPADAQGLLHHLHPTPAVAGLPVASAVSLIDRAEQHDRGLYTGFLGYRDLPGRAQLYVNLRCLQIGTDGLALYLGGGLTASSVPEAEWKETNDKALTLEKLLNG